MNFYPHFKPVLAWVAALFVIFVLLVSSSGFSVLAQEEGGDPLAALTAEQIAKSTDYSTLAAKVKAEGKVRVIILLNTGFAPLGTLSDTDAQAQVDQIAQTANALLASLASHKMSAGKVYGVTRYTYIPSLAMMVDADTLAALLASPLVSSVGEDMMTFIDLASSVPSIDGDDAWAAGYTGSGWSVAILDTGVHKAHAFLSGKVISEACYSGGPVSGTTSPYSLCPGGMRESTTAGSGEDCTYASGCDHGTHVAGIAAGKGDASTGVTYSGVAKDATIIAVQVFSKYGSNDIGAYISDINKGLDRVYALRSTYNIAAVNLSLGGGGPYNDYCDSVSSVKATKAAIDNLFSVGIATVIAAGNDSFYNGVSAPACISSAISVGSTDNDGDHSYFSNNSSSASAHPMPRLMAPGEYVNSSVPSGYASKTGTSMATPHVTGAWAVLKQRHNTTVNTILNAFADTGMIVFGNHSDVNFKRIRIKAALDTLTPPAGKPTLKAPAHGANLADRNPTYEWYTVNEATNYKLYVGKPDGSMVFAIWYDTSVCSGGVCSVTPTDQAAEGENRWYVKSHKVGGGTWSDGWKFYTPLPPPPGKPTLLKPDEDSSLTTSTPTYQWQEVSGASDYQLLVQKPDRTTLYSLWYDSSVCNGGTCSATPSTSVGSEYYAWYVMSSNAGGGTWSDARHFYGLTAPAAPVLSSPSGAITTNNPTFQWSGDAKASHYKLWVGKPDGSLLFAQWYTSSEVGCSSDTSCEITPTLSLGSSTYRWFVKSYNTQGGAWSTNLDFTVSLPVKAWTFMVYLAADNDREAAAISDFLEMASVGSSSNINILVQFDRTNGYATTYGDWTTTKRFYITKDMTPDSANAILDLGELNMGAEATLQDFISWGKSAYPADRYALILWNRGNRGGGWYPSNMGDRSLLAPEGISWDDSSNGDYLTDIELSNVLSSTTNQGADKFDLLGLDASLMATIEVDYHINPYAIARASSQKTEPNTGWPYNTILTDLDANPTWTGQQLADAVATRYFESYSSANSQSALRFDVSGGTSYYTDLVNAVETLANAMRTNMAAEKANIAAARLVAYEVNTGLPYYDFIDLYDFANELKSLSSNVSIDNACDGVMNAISAAITNNQADNADMHGTSIYFPFAVNDWNNNKAAYKTYQYFAQNTHWDEFLDQYFAP